MQIKFQFDSDLNNLSFHTDELAEKEEYYTRINPHEEKKLHLFVSAGSRVELAEQNFELYKCLANFRDEHGLDELMSIAPYQIPSSVSEERGSQWQLFWKDRIDSSMQQIRSEAEQYDFSSQAFDPFEQWVKGMQSSATEELQSEEILEMLGLSRFLYATDNGWNAITSVVVSRADLGLLKDEVNKVEGVYIFDVAEMGKYLNVDGSGRFQLSFVVFFLTCLLFLTCSLWKAGVSTLCIFTNGHQLDLDFGDCKLFRHPVQFRQHYCCNLHFWTG